MATINRTGITGGSTIQPTHVTNIIDALDGTSATTTVIATGSFSGSLKGNADLTALTVDTINFPNVSYTVAAGGGGITLNSDSEDTNTTIKHHGGSGVSSSFLENSLTINAPVIASSFTGSLSGTATSASFATTASYAENAGGSGTGFPFTGSAIISGSLSITGSAVTGVNALAVQGSVYVDNTATGALNGRITGDGNLRLDLSELGKSSAAGFLKIPIYQPTAPGAGSMYWDDVNSILYIYSATNAGWYNIELNP